MAVSTIKPAVPYPVRRSLILSEGITGEAAYEKWGNIVRIFADINVAQSIPDTGILMTGLPEPLHGSKYSGSIGFLLQDSSDFNCSQVYVYENTLRSIRNSITGYCRVLLTYICK